jgi:hypothetical protein
MSLSIWNIHIFAGVYVCLCSGMSSFQTLSNAISLHINELCCKNHLVVGLQSTTVSMTGGARGWYRGRGHVPLNTVRLHYCLGHIEAKTFYCLFINVNNKLIYCDKFSIMVSLFLNKQCDSNLCLYVCLCVYVCGSNLCLPGKPQSNLWTTLFMLPSQTNIQI